MSAMPKTKRRQIRGPSLGRISPELRLVLGSISVIAMRNKLDTGKSEALE
jgi:hypothetical protein